MSVRGKLAWVGIALFSLLTIGAVAGWQPIKLRIRENEGAPHLTRIHRKAQDFAFRTLDGDTKRLSDFKGKTVFVDLWGTWCIQCVAEMPTVQKLYDHYKKQPDIAFLVVSRLDSPAKVHLYAGANHYTLPFYTMEDADIPPSMRLNQFPATFLLSPSGELAAQHVGAADWSAAPVIGFIDDLRKGR